MKKILLALFLILTYCTIQSSAQYNGVGIWNFKRNIEVGELQYSRSSEKAAPKIVLPNLFYDNKGFQQSTFNNQTKVLTLIAQKFYNEGSVIYSIDTLGWKVIASANYTNEYEFGGLESDQTSGNGVFGVYNDNSGSDLIHTMKINFGNNKAISIGSFKGSYRGSVFLPSTQEYYMAFVNNTGLFVKVFDNNFIEIQEKKSYFVDNDFPVNDTPLNLIYDPQNDQIIATVSMQYSSTDVTYGLAYFDFNTFGFDVTNMYGYSGDYFLATVALKGSNYVYTFASNIGGDLYMYEWNFLTGRFLSLTQYYTEILAAF
ncbi:hypothetical protein CYY_003652 [Polysphondylium violaceum]|uniref:Uncharacterized protein n=1 Tax=Polysphondylium violaceum TaxID=133409 RepID=A0A8J4PYS8_9MYCE|nr:hypothetical protein CYY_003652 [Polysphondylium violaceum]